MISPFRRLWFATFFTAFGSQFSIIAIPLIAAAHLGATATQLGMIVAADALPHLLIGLHAGILADRIDRFLLVSVSDVARSFLYLFLITVLVLDIASVEVFIAFAFAIGVFDTLAGAAYHAAVTTSVPKEELARANAKLAAGISFSQLSGPPIAGIAIQILSASFALATNAACFIASALCLVRTRGSAHVLQPDDVAFAVSIRATIRKIRESHSLRLVFMVGTVWQLLAYAHMALYVQYFIRDLAMTPSQVGLLITCAAVGTLISSALVTGKSSLAYLWKIAIAGFFLCAACWIAFAQAQQVLSLARSGLVGVGMFLFGIGSALLGIATLAIVQHESSPEKMASSIAAYNFVTLAVAPIGAIGAGIVADAIGTRFAFGGVFVLSMMCSILLWFGVRQLPQARKPPSEGKST